MATFTFKSPDGQTYDIEGPDGATPEQAFGVLQQHLKSVPAPDPIRDANIAASKAEDTEGGPVQHVIDMVKSGVTHIPEALKGMLDSVKGPDPTRNIDIPGNFRSAVDTASHPGQLLSAAGSALENATPAQVGEHVVAPLLAGGAVSKVAGLAGGAGSAAEAAPISADQIEQGLHAVGFRNLPSKVEGSSLPARVGASVIGESTAAPAMTLNNQAVATRLAQHEAGIPEGQELNYANLAKARAAGPGKVYNAAHDALPSQLTQDEPLQNALASIGDTTSQLPKSPDVDALKSTMLSQPGMTNDQLFSNIQQARDRASRFYASDQPDAHAMGDAYQSVANAYEDFVGRQLAANPSSPVSLKDWQNARTQFAKNYAVQAATQGKDVRISTIARMQQKDPENLTGGLRLIAEQGNRFPATSGFGPSTLADANIGSSGSLSGTAARHVTGPVIGGGIGALLGGPAGAAIGAGTGTVASNALNALIRRALAGNPALGEAAASRAITDPRLADLFDHPAPEEPPEPLTLKPPPGQAFSPHQPQLATGGPTQRDFFGTGANAVPSGLESGAGGSAPAGSGGDIPLADLLSHGVEQRPPEGLSLSPMEAPKQEGMPFKVNTDHAAGDLTLNHEPTLAQLLEDLRDHPAVMSQGVPEGIMTRTANNASGESPASIEAINRTRREQAAGQDRFLIDPDGRMWPVRGVEAADARAPNGSIIVQKGIGGEPYSILDRGGLPRSHANGLLNRALAGGQGLNLGDLLGGS